jgi:hypothetical protein
MMSARASPVEGRASTMLSIFTASTGLSEDTRSPVNGDVNGRLEEGEGEGVNAVWMARVVLPPNASSPPTTRPATTTTAAATATAIFAFRLHTIAPLLLPCGIPRTGRRKPVLCPVCPAVPGRGP